ncbi:hypothetical protein PENANT_c008G09497 [Penicillium antarcticum]|uniref:Uncharacterized protein n=1 Tax=Penicillium antarcticum TaxID=416450 RepID=A0A1V6QA37_9EURO|nr:hypothetical protein PENANT_c008G09497 [Penicillium antarcticum]
MCFKDGDSLVVAVRIE